MTIKRAIEIANNTNSKTRSQKAAYKRLRKADAGKLMTLCSFHHSARGRGYIASGTTRVELYQGKFGAGVTVSKANNTSPKNSNQYFDFDYYIFD